MKIELTEESQEKLKGKVKQKIMGEIFNKAIDNLNRRERFSAEGEVKKGGRIITDTSALLKSGKPPTPPDFSIRFTAPHSTWVEYGTPPHTPPLKPLHDWAERKLKGVSGDEAWAVAKGTQQKIKKEGTSPQPFLRNAVQQVKDKYGKK